MAVGSEFCGAESPAIRDPGVWVVDIGKLGQCIQQNIIAEVSSLLSKVDYLFLKYISV